MRRPLSSLDARCPRTVLAVTVLCCAAGHAHADLHASNSSGVPEQVRPQAGEVGAPTFVSPVQPPPAPSPVSTGTQSGGSTSTPDDGAAMNKMTAQPWGAQASQEAATVGVSATALAATCVMESQCSSNPGSNGTISGTFQMRDDTYLQTMREVAVRNPSLAATLPPGLSGKNDPAVQAIAAAQYLYDGAKSLQVAGVADPTFVDTRSLYQFGPSGGQAVALADPDDLLSSHLNLTPKQYAANGIDPASTTVGQWRQSVASKVGSAANVSVLSR